MKTHAFYLILGFLSLSFFAAGAAAQTIEVFGFPFKVDPETFVRDVATIRTPAEAMAYLPPEVSVKMEGATGAKAKQAVREMAVIYAKGFSDAVEQMTGKDRDASEALVADLDVGKLRKSNPKLQEIYDRYIALLFLEDILKTAK